MLIGTPTGPPSGEGRLAGRPVERTLWTDAPLRAGRAPAGDASQLAHVGGEELVAPVGEGTDLHAVEARLAEGAERRDHLLGRSVEPSHEGLPELCLDGP